MKLTKKEIVSYGCYHIFRNDVTDEVISVKCPNEDYARMGEVDGWKHNPSLISHTWIHSVGGSPEISTEKGVEQAIDGLKDLEYVETKSGRQLGKIDGKIVRFEEGEIDDKGEYQKK